MPVLQEDNYLRLQLLCYRLPEPGTEEYYFLEMSTLQATTLLPADAGIDSATLHGETPDRRYFDESSLPAFRTIEDFNGFFLQHPDYEILNCTLDLDGGLHLHSHDDGEVSVSFPLGSSWNSLIDRIFEKYRLGRDVLEAMKQAPGRYFKLDPESRIVDQFTDFDEYLDRGRP